MPENKIVLTAALKAAWVADLREHPEAQGFKRLTTIEEDGTEKDCCLGRLCKVAGVPRFEVLDLTEVREKVVADEGWPAWESVEVPTGQKLVVYGDTDRHEHAVLPRNWFNLGPDAIDWNHDDIGFRVEPRYEEGRIRVPASECNDSEFTFPQIADLIEYFVTPVEG